MEAADSRPKILHEVLGMEFFPSEPGIVRSRLEVTPAVCQRFGFLSGGASLALAETIAGRGSLALCSEGDIPLGVQVSANHMRAVPQGGVVFGEGRILSQTSTLHVWNIDITDEEGRLVSSARVTNCIKKRKMA